MRTTFSIILLITVTAIFNLYGQTTPVNRGSFGLQAQETSEIIEVDGILDETALDTG